MSEAISRFATAVATSTASARPVCVTSSTVRAVVRIGTSGRVHGASLSPRTPGDDDPDLLGVDGSAPRRNQTKYSTLPGRPGQRARAHARHAEAELLAAPRPTASTASTRSAGVADDAALAEPLAADLELGLHHEHEVGVGVADVARAPAAPWSAR